MNGDLENTSRRSLVLGTAGHIDHGKTHLIRTLTGTDTDRLPEEKKRGITIVLGFAVLEMDDLRLSIVDVPGHEKFVRTMVAGAGGMDMAMLVVSANESVMPQTREHLDIIALLGIERLVVALNKVDIADEETLLIAEDEVRELVSAYGQFKECPIVPCSAVTSEGLEDLKSALQAAAEGLEPRGADEIFRMPIDRSFTVHGHGTVVTGTVVGGRLEKGEDVEIVGTDIRTTAREITTHNENISTAQAGMRAGVNLAGVDRMKARPGGTLAKPGRIWPSSHLAVELQLLDGVQSALKDRDALTFHTGTMRAIATVRIPKGGKIEPGETAPAYLILANPTAAIHGERFILRSFARGRTLGGGVIVDKFKRMPGYMFKLAVPEMVIDETSRVTAQVENSGSEGISRLDLINRALPNENRLGKILKSLAGNGKIMEVGSGYYVAAESVRSLADNAAHFVAEYHKKKPLEPGVPIEEVRKMPAMRRVREVVVSAVLDESIKSWKLVKEGALLRQKSHKVKAAPETEKLIGKIMETLAASGLKAPDTKEFAKLLEVDAKQLAPLFNLLVNQKKVVRISMGYYVSVEVLNDLIAKVREYLSSNDGMTPVEFKEITGLTRKHAIPLLEYLDQTKITLRVGDKRVLFKVMNAE